jgi:hypothetical protein
MSADAASSAGKGKGTQKQMMKLPTQLMSLIHGEEAHLIGDGLLPSHKDQLLCMEDDATLPALGRSQDASSSSNPHARSTPNQVLFF